MGKTLIIAEKPSVMNDIAKALGGFTNHKTHYERGDAVITAARGHLAEIVLPEGLDVGYDLYRLPMLPPSFSLTIATDQKTGKVDTDAKARMDQIRRLMERADVSSVINACDAGREGELIFRYIYMYNRCKKPFTRMWLQSMTPGAIVEAFENQRPGAAMQNLFNAAQCRSEADWIVGINGTRGFSKLHELRFAERELYTGGRVQTPVLALLEERETHIKMFVPRDYWEVHATFTAMAGAYNGKWINLKFDKSTAVDDAAADRFLSKDEAQAIVDKCQGRVPTSVVDKSEPHSEGPPKLFDLTSLQREVNSKFGLSAKKTLDCAQVLYEQFKVLSYPRTDSSALPEDYVPKAKEILQSFGGTKYAELGARPVENDWVKPVKAIFDNTKISDHFAIIPTGERPSGLEAHATHGADLPRIYDLVVRRFIAAFYPAAKSMKTVRLTTVVEEVFKSEGSVMLEPGWKAVYGKEADAAGAKSLCKVEPGELPEVTSVDVKGLKTKHKPRFNDATLLAAMESAGKLLDDDALVDAMREKGLGTPATRAATIEALLSKKRGYANRDGKEIVPTPKGCEFIQNLRKFGITILTSPEMTGEWEYKLKLMEDGKYQRPQFMKEINEATTGIFEKLRAQVGSAPVGEGAKPALGVACPKCSGALKAGMWAYECVCGFKVSKEIASRKMAPEEVEVLVRDGRSALLQGFVSGASKKFNAILVLAPDMTGKVTFEFPKPGEGGATSVAAGEQEDVGECPACKARVVGTGDAYVCTNGLAQPRTCDFRLGGTLLKKKISKTQVGKLLKSKRTDVIDGFVSAKTGNAFSAHLVLDAANKVTWEFVKK
jgi:DNA topoisomerase-3